MRSRPACMACWRWSIFRMPSAQTSKKWRESEPRRPRASVGDFWSLRLMPAPIHGMPAPIHRVFPAFHGMFAPIHGVLSLIQGLFRVHFQPRFATRAWHLCAKIAFLKQTKGRFGCSFRAFANKRAKKGGQPWRKKEGKPPTRSGKRLKKHNAPASIFSPQGLKHSRAALFRTPRAVAIFWKSKRTAPAPPSGKGGKKTVGRHPFAIFATRMQMRLGQSKKKRAFSRLHLSPFVIFASRR